MHRQVIRLLFLLCCCLPGSALAATAPSQSIHVEWSYLPPTSPAVTGFNLYQESVAAPVCGVKNPTATAMDCLVLLSQGVTNFTLTATFDDGTESPHSAPFPFAASVSSSVAQDVQNQAGADRAASYSSSSTQSPQGQGTGSKLFTFQWTAPAGVAGLAGYRLYLDNALLCETSNPAATTISCKADLAPTVMTFSMTQVAADGSESSPSNLLVFDPAAYPELFKAKQLTLSWEYDQGAKVKGFRSYQNSTLICQTNDPAARQLTCGVDRITTPATYALTAVNVDNTETSFSNRLIYTDSAGTGADTGMGAGADKQKLKAMIAARNVSGPAPLTATFDGSASTGGVTGYQWDFGAGSIATTSTANHTYAAAGTYTAKLTVANSSGATSTATVAVTAANPVVAPSTPPTAVISSSTAAGPAPLIVNFNGSGSTATNAILSYIWRFGDGVSGTGAAVSHTYSAAGTYTASLTVTDSKGQSNRINTPIVVTATKTDNKQGATDGQGATTAADTNTVVNADPSATDVKMETGEVAVSGIWVRVSLTTPFANPIVVAGPPSFNNADPCTIRIRNVDKTGFDIAVTKWDYLMKPHPQETVSYLVMEQGHHTLPDGSAVEAGSFTGSASFKTVPFTSVFTKSPVVVTTVVTMNDAKTISGRLKAISTSGFAYSYQEQEKNTNRHPDETVHYIAWEPGSGVVGTLHYAVAKTANSVTDAWYSAKYQQTLNRPPLLLADMQTTNDASPAALRVRNQTAAGFQIKVEAERSKNSKMKHAAETVGSIILDQP